MENPRMNTEAIPASLRSKVPDCKATRALSVERSAIDETTRTVSLAFASETPYERYWGVEILDVSATAMRQTRINSGANLLVDHDTRDVVGVVESVDMGADRVGRAVVRFGKSARAEEVWQDVRDGIRRNVSVGYIIHGAKLVENRDGVDTYRVTDWEPLEISLVSVPADATVGVGRSAEPEPKSKPIPEKIIMTTEITERNHAVEISKMGASIPGGAELAMSAIQRGLTVEQFQTEAIAKLASKPVPTADIGMSKREERSYSLVRAINALANPQDAAAQRAAAFERECSEAAAAVTGKQARGLMVPSEIQKRTLIAGTASLGGNLVQTDVLAGSFIDILRNAMVLNGLGVRFMSGLVGNVAIPKMTGSATAFWVAENTAVTESAQAFAQVTMTPRTLGAFSEISRKLLLQSSIDVENLVQTDLATMLGLAIQNGALNGTGASNQPLGLMTAVAPNVIGGVNGLAPTWQHIVSLESVVAAANADVGNMAYLTNATTRGRLKTTSRVSGQNGFIWEAGDTPVNGYRAAVTNAVPSNRAKGTGTNLSSILFGNFADLVIGMWGGMDLTVDPYTGSQSGVVRLVAMQDVDVAIRNLESFGHMNDAITV